MFFLQWKILGYYHSKDHPRESTSKAFKLDLEAVRPDPLIPLEEYRYIFHKSWLLSIVLVDALMCYISVFESTVILLAEKNFNMQRLMWCFFFLDKAIENFGCQCSWQVRNGNIDVLSNCFVSCVWFLNILMGLAIHPILYMCSFMILLKISIAVHIGPLYHYITITLHELESTL
jgi:hypothetical protein